MRAKRKVFTIRRGVSFFFFPFSNFLERLFLERLGEATSMFLEGAFVHHVMRLLKEVQLNRI